MSGRLSDNVEGRMKGMHEMGNEDFLDWLATKLSSESAWAHEESPLVMRLRAVAEYMRHHCCENETVSQRHVCEQCENGETRLGITDGLFDIP